MKKSREYKELSKNVNEMMKPIYEEVFSSKEYMKAGGSHQAVKEEGGDNVVVDISDDEDKRKDCLQT